MEGDIRREQIINILTKSVQPISGTELAKLLKVSRQVIVQDIALLRATNKNIMATNKGYVLFQVGLEEKKAKRAFKVRHANHEIRDELYTIVDFQGKLLNVVVEHAIYGQILVDLIIANREDADNFVMEVEKFDTKPLTELTNGIHVHTVEADNEEILDAIENKLFEKGYLLKS